MIIRYEELQKKNKSNILFELSTIYGISVRQASRICAVVGIGNHYKFTSLSTLQKYYIKTYVEQLLTTEYELKKKISDDIKVMTVMKSYRGNRHAHSYPVNGQRTRTNHKTQHKLAQHRIFK